MFICIYLFLFIFLFLSILFLCICILCTLNFYLLIYAQNKAVINICYSVIYHEPLTWLLLHVLLPSNLNASVPINAYILSSFSPLVPPSGFHRPASVCGLRIVGPGGGAHSVSQLSDGAVHLPAADRQSAELSPKRSSCKGHRKGHQHGWAAMGQEEEEPENDKSYCSIYSRGVMVHIFVLRIFAEIFNY